MLISYFHSDYDYTEPCYDFYYIEQWRFDNHRGKWSAGIGRCSVFKIYAIFQRIRELCISNHTMMPIGITIQWSILMMEIPTYAMSSLSIARLAHYIKKMIATLFIPEHTSIQKYNY